MADKVNINLEINAAKVIKALNEINKSADTAAGKAALLKKNLMDLSGATGKNPLKLLKDLEDLQGQMIQGQRFQGFKTKIFGVDVTEDVFRETAELIKADDALNKYTTADSKAASANKNFDGSIRQVNKSIGEQQKKLQVLSAELNKLKSPPNGRNALGRFTSATPPSFSTQFNSLSTYQEKLRLVETTITNLQKKTELPFKDIGAGLGKSFPELLKDTNLTAAAIENLSNRAAGLSPKFRSAKQAAMEVDLALTKLQKSGGLALGQNFKQNVSTVADAMVKVKRETGATFDQITAGMKRMGVESNVVRGAINKIRTATEGWKHSIDVVRTALGTLTAVGIFSVLTFITEAFNKASQAARQLELAIYNINNAERLISQQGIDISSEDLRETIDELRKIMPTISRVDATNAVSQIAIFTKGLGLSKEQILQLTQATAVLAVKNRAAGLSFQQVFDQLKTGLLTGTTKGITDLGVNINAGAVELKAMELAGVATKAAFDALNDTLKEQYRAQAILSIVYQQQIGELGTLNEYLGTNDARIEANKAAWEDLLATVGQLFLPFIPALTTFFHLLEGSVITLKAAVAVLMIAFETGLVVIREFFSGNIAGLQDLQKTILKVDAATKKMYANLFFPEGLPKVSPKWFTDFFGDSLKSQETPTGPFDPGKIQEGGEKVAEAVEKSEEKIQDIMEDARQKRLDIDEDYRRKIEDANRDHAQKMADIARDIQRKQEDALRNYNQKVEDINRNAAEAIAEAQADYREREVEREDDFQRRLHELRERFLMDLEDALRERDARQVLRLIREFNLEKKQLADKRRNDQEDAKRDLARKLADIERERVIKLEAAKRELAEKQAEIALWAERERQDAQIALQRKLADARAWHQRELQEYQQYLRRKLEELAKAIAKEYQLTAAGANAIYQVLKGYFGSTGAISTLLGQGLNQSLNRILSSSSGVGGGSSGGWGSFAGSGLYGTFAEGGTLVATRPTKAVFGDAGPEMVSFTPLGRTGRDVNKVFGSLPNVGEGASSIDLRVSLSSDLVAEIIDTSLDNVALHIERINRER